MSKRKTLHLLKNKNDQDALDFIKYIEKSNEIAVVLIQGAVEMDDYPLANTPLILSEDLPPSHKSPYPTINYDRLLDMIFEYDAIITW